MAVLVYKLIESRRDCRPTASTLEAAQQIP
jgi:hypothetical protein